MPKMKSHSGAKKRFNVKKNGSIKRAKQGKNHILSKKTSKRKMGLRQGTVVHSSQEAVIKLLIQK